MKILMVVYDNDSYISWFPQGLAYLASAARNAGHEIAVYQQDIYHWPDSHLTDYLNKHLFDVVEVSVIGGYYQYHKLLSLSQAINASKNRILFKYTIGGHGPASDPEFFLKKTGADVVGIGEGEITFVELLDAFLGKRLLESVDGIAYFNEEGQYIRTKERELIKDIDNIAWPAYDLFDMTYYALMRMPNIKANERALPLLSGRGCIFSCNFCYRLDKGFRPRSAESIIKEILYLMSMDKKVLIIKKDGQEEFYGKLKNVMEQLPAGFLMIHQSYVIHQEYVSEYSYESIKMMNGDVLSVSKPYRKEVRAKIKQYLKEKMYNVL